MSDSIDRAITLLQAAARSKPDDFELNVRLMTAWLQKPDLKAVVGRFRTIVQARPDWTQLQYDVLDRLARDGHVQKLHQPFKAEIAASAADSLTLYGMGLLLQVVEQPDAAEPFFKRAIAADPGFAAVYHNLGLVYRLQNKMRDAIAASHTAIAKSATIAEPHLSLGVWLMGSNKRLALQHFHRFIELHYPHIRGYVGEARLGIQTLEGTLGSAITGKKGSTPR